MPDLDSICVAYVKGSWKWLASISLTPGVCMLAEQQVRQKRQDRFHEARMRKARVQQTAEAKATLARDINLVTETPLEAEPVQVAAPQREQQQQQQEKERRREKLKIPVERARHRMVE